MSTINFFNEDIDFHLAEPNQIKDWVLMIIEQEGSEAETINYIFTSDQHLHQINLQYLNHDTFTDIITFDNSEEEGAISADIFISIERVEENAQLNNSTFIDELHRVIIHGVLHLLGYEDKSNEDKSMMRKKEEACLSLRN